MDGWPWGCSPRSKHWGLRPFWHWGLRPLWPRGTGAKIKHLSPTTSVSSSVLNMLLAAATPRTGASLKAAHPPPPHLWPSRGDRRQSLRYWCRMRSQPAGRTCGACGSSTPQGQARMRGRTSRWSLALGQGAIPACSSTGSVGRGRGRCRCRNAEERPHQQAGGDLGLRLVLPERRLPVRLDRGASPRRPAVSAGQHAALSAEKVNPRGCEVGPRIVDEAAPPPHGRAPRPLDPTRLGRGD